MTGALRLGQAICGVLLLPLATSVAAAESRVVTFSPLGAIKHVRQVTATFSEPMVPLGDPRPALDVFDIQCPEPGSARWVDTRTWAYDFDRDLPAGVRCVFRLRPQVAALDGTRVGGEREFAFSTGGPAVTSSTPYQGSRRIDEDQVFLLVLDAEATARSVLDHVTFIVGDLPQPVGVTIVTGADRDAIVKSRGHRLRPGAPVVLLRARQRFPNGARVTLVWGKGVATASGVATTEDQRLEFAVREPFAVRFSCERENKDAACLPVGSMRIEFSAPVASDRVQRVALVGPGGKRWTPRIPTPDVALQWGIAFAGPFAESSTFRVELPTDLVDDAGRAPVNRSQFPLTVKTAAFPPLAKFASRFSIVEAKGGAALPVTLRRLEPDVKAALLRVDRATPAGGLADWLDRVRATVFRIPPENSKEMVPWLLRVLAAERERSVFTPAERRGRASALTMPKRHGSDAFEVIGIPLQKPGLYIVELESARLGASLLGRPESMYVPAAALVTNLGVHFKWGAETSIVWVTALDTGRPVDGVRITVTDCRGTPLWRGVTDGNGLARVPGLPGQPAAPTCGHPKWGSDGMQSRALGELTSGLFVIAQTPDDMSFVHSSWQSGIEPWRFNLRSAWTRRSLSAPTVLDRSLLRAGDTLHMKHIVRTPVLAGFAPTAPGQRPTKAVVRHVGSDTSYAIDLAWDASGIAESHWKIPIDAKLGAYDVVLSGGPKQRTRWGGEWDPAWVSAQFRVEEFRTPLMRATIRSPSSPQVNVTEVPLDVAIQYLAGGAARRLPVVVRTQLASRSVTFDDFEDFVFANGAVKVGTSRVGMTDDEDDEASNEGIPPAARRGKPVVHSRDALTLDATGMARTVVGKLPRSAVPMDLTAELEFRDAAGEIQTASTRIPLWPSTTLVGVRADRDTTKAEDLRALVAVADLGGRPVAGAEVRVEVFRRKLFSHRKRLVGGFYSYEHVEEVERIGDLCTGRTGVSGVFVCERRAPATGQLILQASTADANGNRSTTTRTVWVIGDDEGWWFDVGDSDRMDVIPERRRYEPGETARLQVRMPFRSATALVTVEREGVIETFVRPLTGADPAVEVPIRPGYAPNAFISVLAIRGRVGDVQPTAVVDLGRPAYKLGLTELRIGWRAYELKVTVTPEHPVYRVRQTAKVRVTARTADNRPPPAGSEIAIAAIDEGLLELAPNKSWDLLEAMMQRRPYTVVSATAQMHVVGKRHFGLKALPSGGAGGRQTTRELFDTLLLWKGRVPLDERGEATVDVPLNDSLTSFRIVAIATGGISTFGTGGASIRTSQDLMVLPGLSPIVREGDRFAAEVTVRNASERHVDAIVTARIAGAAAPLERREVSLDAGDARTLTWDVTAPAGVERLRWEIDAAGSDGITDRVTVEQRVVPAHPVRTYQATLQQWEGRRIDVPVARPADAIPGRGGVAVSLRPSLVQGLDALREWMRRYPYTCLEQQVSRAIALHDEALWARVVASLPSHLDDEGLLKYFPQMLRGSEVLSAYVLSISHASGRAMPDDVRSKIEHGLRAFVEGRITRRAELASPDLTLRKLAAMEALARHGAMTPELASSIAIEPNLWPTSGVLDWWSVLARTPALAQRAARLTEAERIVRARLNVQGTTITFSTEKSDGLWWLMLSADVNAVRLVELLLATGSWTNDVPRIVRGAVGRQRRGAWDLTLANAWGVVALERFSRTFEATPVTGTTAATLAGTERRVDWTGSPSGGALTFAWPPPQAELSVRHEGGGRPWITTQANAAIPLAAPLSSGYTITRSLTPIERRTPAQWSRGDLVRVRLEVQAQTDMTWVVVNDPIPAGASHLGRGLGRESSIVTAGETARGRAWLAFAERAFDGYRAYYQWVPKGSFVTEYTLRLNQAGRFQLPATRVEGLYAPEMFGERPNDVFEVKP